MSKNKVLFLLAVFLVGCSRSATTEIAPTPTQVPKIAPTSTQVPKIAPTPTQVPKIAPTPTQVPKIDSSTPEPTGEPVEEPVTFDFGGKAVYTQLHYDDIESSKLLSGFEFSSYGDAAVTTDFNQLIDGEYSIRLSQYGHLITNPDILPLEGNTTYLVEFDYKILDRGPGEDSLYFIFQPVGENSENQESWISTFDMQPNVEDQGSFTLGGLMGDDPNYTLSINSAENASVVIDNLRILRQDARPVTKQPERWKLLSKLPYPRLGSYVLGTTTWMADGIGGEPQFTYSVNQIERRLAMFDVIAGFDIRVQTIDPGMIFRLRNMNPNLIILPYRIAHAQGLALPLRPLYDNATIDIYYNYQAGLANEWFVKDINGNWVEDPGWPFIYQMNTTEFSPIVNGQTYNDYFFDWIVNNVFSLGFWDGIFFDNLFGRHTYPSDPIPINYDLNLNGLQDETIAWAHEIYRDGTIQMLQRLRSEVGDLEIIMGNTGFNPEIYLSPYVNGYIFECVDEAWSGYWLPGLSEPLWRRVLEEYFIMQTDTFSPTINILEGCGRGEVFNEPDQIYLEPSDKDLQDHRFTLGTTLLSDGFYGYDLFDARSAPYWFDEYTVDENGAAVESPKYKGYLGQALGEAFELASPSTLIWEQDFDGEMLPDELWLEPGGYLSQNADEVITNVGSLVLDNPDHTTHGYLPAVIDPAKVVLNEGLTYVIEFDWQILESLDGHVSIEIGNNAYEVGFYTLPGIITGDSGKAKFPFTIVEGEESTISFSLIDGGKVAIDNIRVTQGGVGPWRRDFENGFVLVNPLRRPYTFTADELAGLLERTNIKRILGTQAPEVNNGQHVIDSLTLQPFDANILLADYIPLE